MSRLSLVTLSSSSFKSLQYDTDRLGVWTFVKDPRTWRSLSSSRWFHCSCVVPDEGFRKESPKVPQLKGRGKIRNKNFNATPVKDGGRLPYTRLVMCDTVPVFISRDTSELPPSPSKERAPSFTTTKINKSLSYL